MMTARQRDRETEKQTERQRDRMLRSGYCGRVDPPGRVLVIPAWRAARSPRPTVVKLAHVAHLVTRVGRASVPAVEVYKRDCACRAHQWRLLLDGFLRIHARDVVDVVILR